MLSGVVASSTTKPILQNVKIEVKKDFIELFATDLEIGIRYFIPISDIETIEEGIVIISESKVEGILRDWIDDTIEIVTEGNICSISGKDSEFTINTESDIDQFPPNPNFPEEGCFEIDQYAFCQLIKRTSFVNITEKIRYILSGISVKIEGNKIEMISTDGRRMSKITDAIDNPLGISSSCIVPVKGLIQLEKVITNELKSFGDAKLKVRIESNRILFKAKNFVYYIQLIDGTYPDCNMFIPKETKLTVNVNVQKLYSAVKRASIVTTEDANFLTFIFNENKLLLKAEVSEIGNAKVVMDVDYDYKEQFEIGFNPDFVKDALNVISSDIVTLEFAEEGKSGVIVEKLGSCTPEECGNFIHVIMPIMLKSEDEDEDEAGYENEDRDEDEYVYV